jgi:hypothetical protein
MRSMPELCSHAPCFSILKDWLPGEGKCPKGSDQRTCECFEAITSEEVSDTPWWSFCGDRSSEVASPVRWRTFVTRMTLEPAYDQAESLTTEARGTLSREQSEWVDAFYRNVQNRMLNLYDGARLGAWRIYEREEVAAYWKEHLNWFNQQLEFIRRTKSNIEALRAPVPEALNSAIETLTDIVQACAGHYELHA